MKKAIFFDIDGTLLDYFYRQLTGVSRRRGNLQVS